MVPWSSLRSPKQVTSRGRGRVRAARAKEREMGGRARESGTGRARAWLSPRHKHTRNFVFLVDVLLLCFVCPLPVLLMWTPRPAANVPNASSTRTICAKYVPNMSV